MEKKKTRSILKEVTGMTAKRFKRYLLDGGFSFGEEYVPPKWSISDGNTKGSPFGFLEFDDEHKDLCDEIVDSLNEFVDEYNHLKEENTQFDILIKNNQLAYIDLEKENEQLKKEISIFEGEDAGHYQRWVAQIKKYVDESNPNFEYDEDFIIKIALSYTLQSLRNGESLKRFQWEYKELDE